MALELSAASSLAAEFSAADQYGVTGELAVTVPMPREPGGDRPRDNQQRNSADIPACQPETRIVFTRFADEGHGGDGGEDQRPHHEKPGHPAERLEQGGDGVELKQFGQQRERNTHGQDDGNVKASRRVNPEAGMIDGQKEAGSGHQHAFGSPRHGLQDSRRDGRGRGQSVDKRFAQSLRTRIDRCCLEALEEFRGHGVGNDVVLGRHVGSVPLLDD